MGGNIKAANTTEPEVERECSVCSSTFKDSVKYSPQRICDECKTDLAETTNLTTSITAQKEPDSSSVSITISVESEVNDSIRIPLEAHADGTDMLIGLLRAESKDENIWYEDAWTIEGYSPPYHVTGGSETKTFTWNTTEVKSENTSQNYDKDRSGGLRKNYQSSVGDPMDATEITVVFEFIDPTMDDLTTTLDVPEYLINL